MIACSIRALDTVGTKEEEERAVKESVNAEEKPSVATQ